MTSGGSPLVLPLDDPDAANNRLLGGKFGRLAEMAASGFAVPSGFGITTTSYHQFLHSTGLTAEARRVRDEASGAELDRVQRLSAELTSAIENAPLPDDLENAIRQSYAELENRSAEHAPPVAVRSSGMTEDLADASFAGQYDTFLWIRGLDELFRHVRRCWASMFNPAVLMYRPHIPEEGSQAADHGICVGVQRMIRARSAGVMFTLDPVTGDRSKIVVEGCWGLGEGVVSGELTPSRYVIDKVTFEILSREIADQDSCYGFDAITGEVGLIDVAEDRRGTSCLGDDELGSLAALAKRIENHRGAAQDVEWAIDEAGDAYLLQVRPETVWSRKSSDQLVGEPKSAVDHVIARFAGVGIARGGPRS